MSQASAPGKVILVGEHAVVYGQPAIAVPVNQLQASARVTQADAPFCIQALDLGRTIPLADASDDDPLALAVTITLAHLHAAPPAATLQVKSDIPIASGLGSGAAVSVAIIRAVARFLNTELPADTVSDLAFQVERIHHGTPSGIDNTVVAFDRPVYFCRGQAIETFAIHTPFRLLIADTGVASPTRLTVGDVRTGREANPSYYDSLFDQIGAIVEAARRAIEQGDLDQLGPLLTANQRLLVELGVSSPLLDRLVGTAEKTGAAGAKLSGGGRGGNLIALVTPETEKSVGRALLEAGAVGLHSTWIGSDKDIQE